jgi:type V secretory pathway adhesin AidA
VFGIDGKPFLLKGGSMFVPSIFVGCAQEDFHYTINSHNNSNVGGLRLSWLNKDYGRLNLIYSCGAVKTNNSDCTLRSHILFLISHYGHSLLLENNLSIIPAAQFDYSAVSVKDAKIKNIRVDYESLHSLRASAGINLQLKVNSLTFSIGTKLSTKFSAEKFGKFKDVDIDSPEADVLPPLYIVPVSSQ